MDRQPVLERFSAAGLATETRLAGMEVLTFTASDPGLTSKNGLSLYKGRRCISSVQLIV